MEATEGATEKANGGATRSKRLRGARSAPSAAFALCLSLAMGCVGTDVASPDAVVSSPALIDEGARFPALSDAQAWERVPRATPELPEWARILVDALPRTTALQLDLDSLHRTRNPLGPIFGARLRWAVADANRCAYAKASVEADLVRAGLTPDEARAGDAGVPESERLALAFARDLTLCGWAIPDAQVAELVAAYGPDDAVAIVHTVAHANFQNRIFLALGVATEPNGPVAPREVRPTADARFTAPPRPLPAPAEAHAASAEDHAAPPEANAAPPRSQTASADAASGAAEGVQAPWRVKSFDELRAELARQKARAPRIAPADPVRLARLPRPDRERVAGTTWGKVSMGYQPVLTSAWFQTMGAFESEAQLDMVFANTIFWVVTRTNECFY